MNAALAGLIHDRAHASSAPVMKKAPRGHEQNAHMNGCQELQRMLQLWSMEILSGNGPAAPSALVG